MTTVLIIEDDAKIASVLVDALKAGGFDTIAERDGLKAVSRVRQFKPDVIILDRGLPGLDGLEVCRQVSAFSTSPILMLTARVEEDDRLAGFATGAADYICKPFSVREVVARVAAAARRSQCCPLGSNARMPLRIDENAQVIATEAGEDLCLTPVEFRLLRALAHSPGRVFSRADLLDHIHCDFRDISDRAIDSHIKNLRKKLERVPDCTVASIYGVGYRLDLHKRSLDLKGLPGADTTRDTTMEND